LVKSKKRKPAKAENASSVTRAFQALRELIVRGNLPPGAWIVEAEIASQLGLSRTPIRSALQWLHREGYVVEHKGNRKARIVVAPLTREDARELHDHRPSRDDGGDDDYHDAGVATHQTGMMARADSRFELLTTENRVTMMYERTALGNKREVYLGRREHATKGDPTFLGDSIGRVDGDTLIVDTTRFNDATWLNDLGAPHSDALRLIERFRLVGNGRYLEYQVTAEDPKTLAKPHSYTRYYQRSANELQEDFCEDRR